MKKIILSILITISTIGFSQSNTTAEEDITYTVVEQMPQFPGGESEKIKFVQKNIKYPESAKKNKLEGKCFLKFAVMKDGSIKDITILKGVPGCPECDEEAMRVISIMPKWIPGKQNGNLVNVFALLPIKFTL